MYHERKVYRAVVAVEDAEEKGVVKGNTLEDEPCVGFNTELEKKHSGDSVSLSTEVPSQEAELSQITIFFIVVKSKIAKSGSDPPTFPLSFPHD